MSAEWFLGFFLTYDRIKKPYVNILYFFNENLKDI